MDFNTLTTGAPFYVLRKEADKPTLLIGTIKAKSAPLPKYQPQAVPNAFAGANVQQVISITATINDKDEVYTEVPINIEVAAKGNDTFTGSREAMIAVIDNLIQQSKKAIETIDYHRNVIAEGDKMLETLNPRYAEEKKQARTIADLQSRQEKNEQMLQEIYDVVIKLQGAGAPAERKKSPKLYDNVDN